MSVSGLCGICQAAESEAQCTRCGAMVCDDHHDERRGVCAECSGEFPGSGPGIEDRTDDPDVDHYEF
jgi:hypothetical protein